MLVVRRERFRETETPGLSRKTGGTKPTRKPGRNGHPRGLEATGIPRSRFGRPQEPPCSRLRGPGERRHPVHQAVEKTGFRGRFLVVPVTRSRSNPDSGLIPPSPRLPGLLCSGFHAPGLRLSVFPRRRVFRLPLIGVPGFPRPPGRRGDRRAGRFTLKQRGRDVGSKAGKRRHVTQLCAM